MSVSRVSGDIWETRLGRGTGSKRGLDSWEGGSMSPNVPFSPIWEEFFRGAWGGAQGSGVPHFSPNWGRGDFPEIPQSLREESGDLKFEISDLRWGEPSGLVGRE